MTVRFSPGYFLHFSTTSLQLLDEMKHYSLKTVEIAIFDEADRLFEGTLAVEVSV